MFQNEELKTHIETSPVLKTQSAVIAEWNMNIESNIQRIGNYRYRPLAAQSSVYRTLVNSFDPVDAGKFYTDATDADIVVDGGFTDTNSPILFTSKKDKTKLIYSLEDCFRKFRPRSGINKASYFNKSYIHHSNMSMFSRPRYYMADKDDKYKYWTSYRTEDNLERGIANKLSNGQHYIEDAAPFVVYKQNVPANRIVVKMQTNVGSVDLGPFVSASGSVTDPLYGDKNKTTPVKWKIQYLENNNWIDAISFNSSSTRRDGTPIIKSDGYVELSYGLNVPDRYRNVFIKAEEYSSVGFLPTSSVEGYAYLIQESSTDIGQYHIWFNGEYEVFDPTYSWQLSDENIDRLTNFVTDLTAPISFTSSSDGKPIYREFKYLSGIRVVAETMNKVDATLDLIEISPRLCVDLSDKTLSYSITKTASDLGNAGMPVGQLLASVGSINLFDYDQAFSENNKSSIVYNFITNNLQIKFYEVLVDVNGFDYFVPIKTMYSEGFPTLEVDTRSVSIELRDMYFYLESITAPQMLVTDVSLSYAVSLLLDSIGFSNYTFKRITNEKELIIPFFFIAPDKTVAQVLNELAVSTQTAMFFDEYNNFVLMSKDYMLPTKTSRVKDFILYGSDDFQDTGILENKNVNKSLTNIINIASKENNVFNDGVINYKTRYIQRTYGSTRQASLVDNKNDAKSWIYKPVLLWEVAGEDAIRSFNSEATTQSRYSLSAIPLNSNLSSTLPQVVNNRVVNNTLDLGESVYWLTRDNGYFYANGEIIRFDAVEYSVSGSGNVWISDVQEYQNYFSKLPFNGKMYATGLIRIYSEPNYEVVSGITKLKNGPVAKHGRGQFGTPVQDHYAGLNSYWSNNTYVRGCTMQSKYLFGLSLGSQSSNSLIGTLGLIAGEAGINNALAEKTTRNGIIKNFNAVTYLTETGINSIQSAQTGTIQSSALVMNGPSFDVNSTPIDFISYQYKELSNKYKHFGTRMRIVGKIENNESRGQTPIGTNTYYVVTGSEPSQPMNISGGSGGLAVMLNPATNNGYYFEIIALTANNIGSYAQENSESLDNIIFYKIYGDASKKAVPVKLWGGLSNIITDNGNFVGQYRLATEENPTVYDLAVEYQDIGSIRRFFLYVNNKIIATVDDESPLPIYNHMAVFVRGSSRCMFENVYALGNNYSQNTVFALDTPVASAFDDNDINANESFRKYAMSGIVQSTYLSGVSTAEPPKYNMYFEEFGTIMREAAYFNFKYDKAYPALYAQLTPTFNRLKGYTVSGFKAGSYGAEFLIFNATDKTLSIDETSENYLRIQGITFTQESNNELSLDQYFAKHSDFSNPEFKNNTELVVSPLKAKKDYEDIKVSRLTYGNKDFSIDAPYIQSQDAANELMAWLVTKITKPRKSIGVKIFANPMIQLGDLVTLNYKDKDGIDQVASSDTRFVVYNIEYSKDSGGPNMTVHLSEVTDD
jgi:hypothetical protein